MQSRRCAIDLGEAASSDVVSALRNTGRVPTIALMVAYPSGSAVDAAPFDAAAVTGSDAIKLISKDSSKPGGSLAALLLTFWG